MADHVVTLRGADVDQPAAALTGPGPCLQEYVFDVAGMLADGFSMAAADTVTFRTVGSRSLVLAWVAEVVQADTGATARTIGVGDGDSATFWHTALDLKTVAITHPLDGVATATAKQKFYPAGGLLKITLNHTLVDAIVKFQWLVVPFMPYGRVA